MADELYDGDEVITLTDENGVEEKFTILAIVEHNGKTYYALVPENPSKDEEDGYVILRVDTEDGEDILVTIDDDDEFDDVADEIDDYLNSEVDYDEGEDE